MRSALAVALTLAALVLAPPLGAQGSKAGPAPEPIPPVSAPASVGATAVLAPAIWSSLPPAGSVAPSSWTSPAAAAVEIERMRRNTTPSRSRHLWTGAGIGAAAGALFGLWVISIADCGGPGCTGERVLGVAGNALGGAAIGALIGGAVYLIRR